MTMTMFLIPAALALALWGGVMAVSGFRQGNKLKLLYAAGAFALLTVCGTVLMEFITRPLCEEEVQWKKIRFRKKPRCCTKWC